MYVERTFIRKRKRWRPVNDYLRKQSCFSHGVMVTSVFKYFQVGSFGSTFGIAVTG